MEDLPRFDEVKLNQAFRAKDFPFLLDCGQRIAESSLNGQRKDAQLKGQYRTVFDEPGRPGSKFDPLLYDELVAVKDAAVAEAIMPGGKRSWQPGKDFSKLVYYGVKNAIRNHLRLGGAHHDSGAVGGVDKKARKVAKRFIVNPPSDANPFEDGDGKAEETDATTILEEPGGLLDGAKGVHMAQSADGRLSHERITMLMTMDLFEERYPNESRLLKGVERQGLDRYVAQNCKKSRPDYESKRRAFIDRIQAAGNTQAAVWASLYKEARALADDDYQDRELAKPQEEPRDREKPSRDGIDAHQARAAQTRAVAAAVAENQRAPAKNRIIKPVLSVRRSRRPDRQRAGPDRAELAELKTWCLQVAGWPSFEDARRHYEFAALDFEEQYRADWKRIDARAWPRRAERDAAMHDLRQSRRWIDVAYWEERKAMTLMDQYDWWPDREPNDEGDADTDGSPVELAMSDV